MCSASPHCSPTFGNNCNNTFYTELLVTADNYFYHCRLFVLQAKQFIIVCVYVFVPQWHMVLIPLIWLQIRFKNVIGIKKKIIIIKTPKNPLLFFLSNFSKITLLLTTKLVIQVFLITNRKWGAEPSLSCQECSRIKKIPFIFLLVPTGGEGQGTSASRGNCSSQHSLTRMQKMLSVPDGELMYIIPHGAIGRAAAFDETIRQCIQHCTVLLHNPYLHLGISFHIEESNAP